MISQSVRPIEDDIWFCFLVDCYFLSPGMILIVVIVSVISDSVDCIFCLSPFRFLLSLLLFPRLVCFRNCIHSLIFLNKTKRQQQNEETGQITRISTVLREKCRAGITEDAGKDYHGRHTASGIGESSDAILRRERSFSNRQKNTSDMKFIQISDESQEFYFKFSVECNGIYDTDLFSIVLDDTSIWLLTEHGTWIFGIFIKSLLKVTRSAEHISEWIVVIGYFGASCLSSVVGTFTEAIERPFANEHAQIRSAKHWNTGTGMSVEEALICQQIVIRWWQIHGCLFSNDDKCNKH